uniref:Putative FBD domain-containing protein n=1 Tax=Helianthus annuus TaxID=4232 RepID=A0A251TPU3_HELAN
MLTRDLGPYPFSSLRSLCLYVKISTKALLHLLSNCPSLKRFSLLGSICDKDCTIIELFDCLHVIEDLTIYGDTPELLVLDSVPNELPTSLIHLKYFCFNELYFGDDHGLIFLLILIKCSPNLEKIELDIAEGIGDDNETLFGILEKYSDVRLEHLKELEIHYFSNLKHEMELVTVILARSPKLKKVIIHSLVEKDEESDMLKILLQASRASPVEIVLGSICDKDCTIIELFDCLHVIEDLTIYGDTPELLVLDSVPNELPTSLIHLKYFCFNEPYFGEDHGLIFLLILIKCSPNLEKIELDIDEGIADDNETWFGILEENSDVRLEHLKELEIHRFSNLRREMELVTVILARSPKLKKVIIHSLVEKDEESDMLKILLQASRASPVEIVVID